MLGTATLACIYIYIYVYTDIVLGLGLRDLRSFGQARVRRS